MFKKQWLIVLIAFVFPIIFIWWWWGGFNRVEVRQQITGPYHYAYQDYLGNLADAGKAQAQVRATLTQAGIPVGDSITVLMTDPRKTREDRQQAQVGYLVAENIRQLPAGIKQATLPRRKVLAATVQAGVMIAPSKAYQALYDYLKARGQDIRPPTVEIYRAGDSINRMGFLTVQMAE